MKPGLSDDAFLAGDGTALAMHVWGPAAGPRAVIVAAHGMNDHGGSFDMPGRALARAGIRLYAHDQRGHGAAPDRGVWAGHQCMAQDLSELLGLARARHPDAPLFLLGESMGAAIAVLAAGLSSTPRLDGMVLSAPAIRPLHAVPPLLRLVGRIAHRLTPWLTVPVSPPLESKATDNHDMLRRMAADPLIPRRIRVDMLIGVGAAMDAAATSLGQVHAPVLFLFGDHDSRLSAESRKALLAHARAVMPGVEARCYRDGYHLLLRDRQAARVYDDLVTWIEQRPHT